MVWCCGVTGEYWADPRGGWVSKGYITISLARCSLETQGLETFYSRVVGLWESCSCKRTGTVQVLDSRTGLRLLSKVGILSGEVELT